MHLTLLSRASDLAVLQARQVARALEARHPGLSITLVTRATLGDRDRRIALADAADKGLFTADLSDALVAGEADLVVHSWKDLPVEDRRDTVVAGTLERADPRDVLLVGRDVIALTPARLRVLTSSPRRAWQITQSLRPLLPWPVTGIDAVSVRGNIPTRVRALVNGDADALVVAKAALDRLLGDDAPEDIRRELRANIDRCRWMVLPIREFPSAPAQGALAIEVARARPEVIALVDAISDAATSETVREERRVLSAYGGGCHEAIGVTVLPRAYGHVRATGGRLADGATLHGWTLARSTPDIGTATLDHLWPRQDERRGVVRRPLENIVLPPVEGLWIARAEALPSTFTPSESQIIWSAGTTTWRTLASRGVWVHGSAEGLGDLEAPAVDRLAGHAVPWLRLTHDGSGLPGALATYTTAISLPRDLPTRTHFFWTSGSTFRQALAEFPAIRGAHHASGPGRTAAALADGLGPDGRVSIWLDYDEWLLTILR